MNQISVMNESSVVTDAEVAPIIAALEQQWNTDLLGAWKVDRAAMTFIPAGQNPPAGSSWLVFLDDTDQAQKLAYHDLSNDGSPIAKVFAKSLVDNSQSLSVAASHEICEMAIDPKLLTSYQDSNGAWWAAEICDPVESDQYAYSSGGILLSDFVTPRWFDLSGADTSFDKQRLVHRSFEILAGGYAQQWDNTTGGWDQVNGFSLSPLKLLDPSSGSRRDRRRRKRSIWFRSHVDRSLIPVTPVAGKRRTRIKKSET